MCSRCQGYHPWILSICNIYTPSMEGSLVPVEPDSTCDCSVWSPSQLPAASGYKLCLERGYHAWISSMDIIHGYTHPWILPCIGKWCLADAHARSRASGVLVLAHRWISMYIIHEFHQCILSMGTIHGYHSRVSSMDIIAAADVIHVYHPWIPTINIIHDYHHLPRI